MNPMTKTMFEAIIAADDEITIPEKKRLLALLNGEQNTPSRLLTMKQVADRFSCTVRTVQRWCRDGEIQTIKRGRLVRIPEEALYANGGSR